MKHLRSGLSDLAPEEIERIAHEHVKGIVSEIQAAADALHARVHPVNVIKRHPLATAALAGAAAFLLARMFRGSRRAPAYSAAQAAGSEPSVGKAFGRSLLSGVAGALGRALPDLLLMWYSRRRGRQQ